MAGDVGDNRVICVEFRINDSVVIGAPVGSLVGMGLGVIIAGVDLSNHLKDDRSGIAGVNRLVSNLLWIAIYAGVLNAVNSALLVAIVKLFVPFPILRLWMPAIPFVLFGLVNLAVILWASIHTTQTQDVLSPRLLSAKLKRSTQLEG